MGTQFIHVELYGKQASKEKARQSGQRSFSASDIAAEQMRVEGHTDHVALPEPPQLVFGVDPRLVINAAVGSFDAEPKVVVKTKTGPKERAMRADTPIVLVGVVSWPDSVEELANSVERQKLFDEWKAQNLLWLRKKYGRDLRSVVLHNDESHPHMHFTVTCDRAIDIRKHHPAGEAKSKTEAVKGLKALQDEYFTSVAVKCGLARVGPRRQRLKSGAEWKMQKEANEQLALEWLKLGERQQLVERAEKEADESISSAWAAAEKIVAEAMAEATQKATEILRAAKDEAKKVLGAARTSLELLRKGNAEVEDTLRHLQSIVPPEALKKADKRQATTKQILSATPKAKGPRA